MKVKSTLSFTVAFLCLAAAAVCQPTAGDYRSNVSPTGLWNDPLSWQTYDGLGWITASAAPSSADGIVTILSGDSIRLNTATTIDQVVVDAGGVLAIFNTVTPTTFTLNNNADDDIIVDGRLYLAIGGTLSGAGTVRINSTGNFILTNAGILSVATTNAGLINVANSCTILNTTLTNNNDVVWSAGNISMNNSSFVNNDSMVVTSTTNVNMASTAAPSFTNNAAGVLYKSSATGNLVIFPPFTNHGTVKGQGTILFANVAVNNGIISPGNSPATLTVTNTLLGSKPTSLNIEISTTGAVAGTDYDQLVLTSVTPASAALNNATLNVTNTASDPVGTIYTIINYPSPVGSTITGSFATLNVPSNFTVANTGTAVTLQKIALFPLPLVWGTFQAIAKSDKVQLDWTTLQEANTAYFDIEFSTNNGAYSKVGTIPAKGFSSTVSEYSFLFSQPDLKALNLFRIKQVDLDGKASYSSVRPVKFAQGKSVTLLAYPNPVRDVLQLNVQARQVDVQLVDGSGKVLKSAVLQQGYHSMDLSQFPTGIYQLVVVEGGVKVDVQKIIKH